mgnify:CR=1 FL=1
MGASSRSARTARIETLDMDDDGIYYTSRSARTARIETPAPLSTIANALKSRSARTARIETQFSALISAINTVAVRKDRED